MNPYHLSIEDVEQESHLTRKYIDRCYARFGHLLSDTRKKAVDKNKYLYNQNALIIFREIKVMRDRGMHIPEIQTALESQLGTPESSVESDGEVQKSTMESIEQQKGRGEESNTASQLLSALQNAHRIALESKNETIQEKDRRIQSLEEKVLLLTDGRSPELVKNEREQAIRDKDSLTRLRRIQQRKSELLHELTQTTGLLSGRKRRDIIKKLQELDNDVT